MDDAESWLNEGLLIPYALTVPLEADPKRRRRIHPEDAQKGQSYYCPECGQVLHLYGGTHVQRLHFRHDEYLIPCGFREDGADRVIARHSILDAVLSWVEDRSNPDLAVHITRRCPTCGALQPKQLLPERVAGVHLKRAVRLQESNTSRSADVALVDDQDHELCLVEIHRDREAPQFRFQDVTLLPWIVVRAKPAIADPHALFAEYEGNLKAVTCKSCLTRPMQSQEALDWNNAPWINTQAPDNSDALDNEATRWTAKIASNLPAAIIAESESTNEALIVDIETSRVYKGLRSPIGQVVAHCHYLNTQSPRRVYCVVKSGRVLPPFR